MNSTSTGAGGDYAYFKASWADGDAVVGLKVQPDDWQLIVGGDQVSLKGGYYFYDGAQYGSLWEFNGGLDGLLTISYYPVQDELDIGEGYVGSPRDVMIRALQA